MQDDLFALCEYNQWADARLVDFLRQLTPDQYIAEPAPGCPSVRATFVHLADTHLIWARRIAGETVTARTPETDVPTLDDAIRLLERAHESLRVLLPTLSSLPLSAPLVYHDLRGQEQSLPRWAVLRHLINHSSYHRGQITVQVMRFGLEPPLMDLALWVMENA